MFSILASRPLERPVKKTDFDNDENIFFGSFDRVDKQINKISWKQFEKRLDSVLNEDRNAVIDQDKTRNFYCKKCTQSKVLVYICCA